MAYQVMLRNNETDESRLIPISVEWNDGSYFLWTNGNMKCDCNREKEFYRQSGYGLDFDDLQCSYGRFSALYALMEDGTRVILDDSDEAETLRKVT